MQAETFRDLFERELEFAYDCEQRLMDALPRMADAASSDVLRNAFEDHLDETKQHIDRLEQVFSTLDRAAARETNHGIQSLISEGEKLIKHIDRSPLLDAALIVSGVQVEHYEIALYGSLCSFARNLGLDDVASLLARTLDEERAAIQTLARIGDDSVNREAVGVVTTNHEFNFI